MLLYQDEQATRPFALWFDSLDVQEARKVQAAIDQLAGGNLPEVKSVGAGVLERRIHWGPGYRVYFGRDGGQLIILLAGGMKKQQARDILTA